MALVMLPCDLPWWPAVVKELDNAAVAKNSRELVDVMQRILDMCNISLDPDEDLKEPNLFDGLERFIEQDLSASEKEHFFTKTIPRIVNRAKSLKAHRPPYGLHFSLQQQGDVIEHNYSFVASLIANAFFSTYPKRTPKTHPTLRDFNFTNFFKHLHIKCQKAKLLSLLYYFDFLETERALEGSLLMSRQVMNSRQWLTIEDWLESTVPLCPLTIRHEGRLESETKALQVSFASSKLGGDVLDSSVTQETIQVATHPELLVAMLCVEALEDNEALIVEGLRHISKIQDPKCRSTFESIPKPNTIVLCCIDADDYSTLPLAQFEEDNILRELNKSLLGFRQRRQPPSPMENSGKANIINCGIDNGLGMRRLSPIGESFSSASPEFDDFSGRNILSYSSCSQTSESCRTRGNGSSTRGASPGRNNNDSGKRSSFIVLGSSGEALPVNRNSMTQASIYNSCSSSDSYHSCQDNLDQDLEEEESEEKLTRRYSTQLDTPEGRGTFAQRLKDALKREYSASNTETTTTTTDSSSESSYAVGISVSGSKVQDKNIKVKRGSSRGFVLRDESVDERFLNECQVEPNWLGKLRQNHPQSLQRKDTSASSKYSFSTENTSDLCSELEEVYEQLSKWLEEPINNENKEFDPRDRAVVTFASSLLKRALSESFAGVPVQEGEPQPFFDANDIHQRHKLALAVRSLSLELARQKIKRQQSVSGENSPQSGGLLPIATGNWGCGSRHKGDPQIKFVIQWLAASMAGVPRLIYYTFSHSSLSKLDTISRILTDRQWTVGDLAAASLKFSIEIIEERHVGRNSLFEELIGVDKPSP